MARGAAGRAAPDDGGGRGRAASRRCAPTSAGPQVEAFAADIGHTKQELRHCAKHVAQWVKPTKVRLPVTVAPAKGWIVPEPLGVALVIAPWNYPIQLLVEPLGAALAAGNCVLAKPSELAPACSAALARLLPRYVDPDAVVVVEGGVDETTALLAERWDHIFFTGSTAVGRIVAEAAAKHLTPTVLELGGKSPTYVHRSADLDVAARRIAWGKFLNAGQTCIAPDYVLVDHQVKDALVDKLGRPDRRLLRRRPAGEHELRPHRQRPPRRRACRACSTTGAGTVATGGEVDAAERFVAPTVTVEPEPGQRRSCRRRSSGRSCPVLGVDGPDEAKAFVTARPKPLALYVFAQQDDVVDDVVDDTTQRRRVREPDAHAHPPAPTCPSAAWATAAWARTTARPASTPSATARACCASPPARPQAALPALQSRWSERARPPASSGSGHASPSAVQTGARVTPS